MSDSVIDNLYKLRRNFALIGLTGRTGSGCTTIAKLLEEEKFENLNLPEPSTRQEGIPNDERKYKIIYNFAKENWQKFFTIRASDIIFYFVLKEGYEVFLKSLLQINNKVTAQETSKKDDLNKKYLDLKKDFDENHKLVLRIEKFLSNRKSYSLRYEKDKNKVERVEKEAKEYKEFIFKKLPVFRKRVSEIIGDEMSAVYQAWGNSIRKYGRITEGDEKTGNEKTSLVSLAKKINAIIKMLEDINIYEEVPTLIIIDALRNPYEVMYFRERFAAFYLLAVSTYESKRKENLYSKNFKDSVIKDLDEMEYPKSPKELEDSYFEQDVQKCIELADVFIFNDGNKIESNKGLKKQIIQYISLILHPGLVSPTPVERIMQIAHVAKLNSGCLSRQVGACVTDENFSLKSIGWNTVPEGQTPCSLCNFFDLAGKHDESAFSDYEISDSEFLSFVNTVKEKYGDDVHKKLKGLPLTFCFKDFYTTLTKKQNQVHTRSLHAEENAFLQLAKYGSVGTLGGKLFATASPCELCAKKAYQLGIKEIYYIDVYPGISFSHIINNGDKEKRPKLIHFQGAIGRAYDSFYNPIVMLKDEIAFITRVKVKEIGEGEAISKKMGTGEENGTNIKS